MIQRSENSLVIIISPFVLLRLSFPFLYGNMDDPKQYVHLAELEAEATLFLCY